MLQYGVLATAFGLLVTTASAADPPSASQPKLSDDARKFMSYCNEQMEKDYQNEVLIIRGHAQQVPDEIASDQEATKRILHERWLTAKKFVRGILIPRSRKRLIAYISKYSPAEIQKLNELTQIRRRSEAESKRVLEIQDDLGKIEDEVLKEVPESRFPKFK